MIFVLYGLKISLAIQPFIFAIDFLLISSIRLRIKNLITFETYIFLEIAT